MNSRLGMVLIIVVIMIAGMGMVDWDGLKTTSVRADRASMSSAFSTYYQQMETVPLLTKQLKDYKTPEMASLYNALVDKFTAAYVDANMFVVDTSELKRAKALNKLADTDRLWVGDKNDPTILLTPGDELDFELMASIDVGDKTLASMEFSMYKSTKVTALTASASDGSNGVILGGANALTSIKWDSSGQPTERDLSSMFTPLGTPTYIVKPSAEVQLMNDSGVIFKGVD